MELADGVGRSLIYWLQVVAAGHGRIYKELEPEFPPPLIERFEHPDRPEPPPGDEPRTDDGLLPALTPEIAREIGLI